MLVGAEPKQGFPFSKDPSLPHTIGNYWPYATTVFDYIRRAMPPDAPGSLSDADVYNLTAFLLNANELIPADAVIDADVASEGGHACKTALRPRQPATVERSALKGRGEASSAARPIAGLRAADGKSNRA